MLKIFLLVHYLRRRKIVLLSIAAVALSTALLIVVSSLFTGFIRAFEQAAVEAMGDVVLTPPTRFAKYSDLIQRLEQLGVVDAATATLSSQGLLYIGRGNVRAVKAWGIEPVSRAKVTGFKQSLLKQKKLEGKPSFEIAGSAGPGTKVGGFVGIGVVAKPDETTDEYNVDAIEKDMIGREVVLITGSRVEPESSSEAGQNASSAAGRVGIGFKRRNIPFTIADVVFTGVHHIDTGFVYLPIEELQKRLYPNETSAVADQIHIKLAPDAGVDAALAQIRGVWEAFAAEQLQWDLRLIRYTDIETAKRLQSQYVAELWKQMRVLLLIFGVVSFGVVLLVFCIFYMITRLKQKDIAIIKSYGAGSTAVALIFVSFGACVGLIGAAAGTALGCIITKNINAIEELIRIIFGLKLWKSSVYMFSRIPSEVDWRSVVIILSLAVAAVVAGAFVPAVTAAQTKPVNILRYE